MGDITSIKSRIEELHVESERYDWQRDDIAQWKSYCLYLAAGHGYLPECEYLVVHEGADPTVKHVKG